MPRTALLLAALLALPAAPAPAGPDAGPGVGGDPAAGQAVYQQRCRLCHDRGMMGAPRLGDRAAWEARLARGEEALLQSVIRGLKAMPPRGGCRSCTDRELADALAYMLKQAR